MAHQRTASTVETQVDDTAVLYSDDESVRRLAALLKRKDNKNSPGNRKTDQPSCRPYRVASAVLLLPVPILAPSRTDGPECTSADISKIFT